MKVVVSGSRGINDYDLVRNAFINSGIWKRYKNDLTILHGACRNSPDIQAGKFAKNNSLECFAMPADWDAHGKRAGMLRNIEMAKLSDALVAIWDGSSRGTKQMIDFCKGAGLYCYVLDTSTGEVEEFNKESLNGL